jgi:DNA-directed RNA polymerase specialized sigma24 family protein
MTDLKLARIMAAERTKDCPDKFDDAVQEALIAGWRYQRDGEPDRWRMRRAVADVVRGRPSFGHESQQGKPDAYAKSTAWPEGFDVAQTGDHATQVALKLRVQAILLGLSAEDRQLVFRRFWLDLEPTKKEHNRWRTLKVLLAEQLSDAVA